MSSNDFQQHLNMEEQVRPPPGQPPGTASSLGGQQQQSSVLTGSSISLCQLKLFLLIFFGEIRFHEKKPSKNHNFMVSKTKFIVFWKCF